MMKTVSTEVDAITSTVPTTYARQPFKLLQNFQQCQIFVRHKMALSSSTVKSIVNRPRKVESIVCQPKESTQTGRPRASSISSRQKNAVNTRTTTKTNGVAQRRSMQLDSKTKVPDSISDSTNSVGSLTSSPKWSHIKNKFENGSTIAKNKPEKTALLSKDEETVIKKQTNSKSLNSLVPEIHLGACKAKVCGRTEIKKVNDSSVTKPSSTPRVVSPKTSSEKRKTENSVVKNLNSKDKSKPRCSSPKNSYSNTHTANASHLHSSVTKTSRFNSTTNKLSSLHASSLSKTSHSRNSLTNSSVSLSSNSSKNSELDSNTVKKCSTSSVSSELSDIDIPSTETLAARSTLKSKSSCASSPSSDLVKSNESCTNLISTLSTTSSMSYKPNLYRVKQKHEDKPILTFNRTDQCESAKPIKSKLVRNSVVSTEKEMILSNILNKDKTVKTLNPSNKQSSYSTNSILVTDDQVEKIKDVVKNSQTGSKTVWVKNEAGNWTKKGNSESNAGSENTISQSKVASLRSKFLEPTKETSTPLTKSVTTSSVPSKTEFSRPLAKSSTTSSICDKSILKDIINENSHVTNTNASNSQATPKTAPAVTRNSLDGDTSLNIVQRAILSFEGSLALLSPESQRRLKLVNEKVQAQTDDVKILKARKNEFTKTTSGAKSVQKEKPSSTPKTDTKVIGEPFLSTRSFLTKYQLTNKQVSKDPKNGFRSYIKADETLKNTKQTPTSSSINLTNLSKKLPIEKQKNVMKGQETKEQSNKPNSLPTTSNTSPTSLKQNSADSSPKSNTENEYTLQPNPSFLWCRSRTASSDLSKSSTTSTVSLTSSDYRSYYDVQNYYSTLDLEIDKTSDISEEPIYIDSQDSNSSDYNYTSSGRLSYQNILPTAQSKSKNAAPKDEWSDGSDDDFVKSSLSNNEISTVRRRRNKRSSSQKDGQQNFQYINGEKRHYSTDTISFTDSSDTLINDEVQNESTYDLGDSNHFYEPVYESLSNYLRDKDDQDENCSISLSPDDKDAADIMQCSLTSLESVASSKLDKDETHDSKNPHQKKSGNTISQIKRHLSWTKNDIRLELSSKSNKIKIKKNGQTSTEIGLKVQEHGSVNTSPKKKTFIKCILRQKSASSIPLKRSPSPKKESAMFYVHLTMGREKQRPFSDSVVDDESSKNLDQSTLKARKQSEPILQQQVTCKDFAQRPRFRKVSCVPRVQRPKTPPPLPPLALNKTENGKEDASPIEFIDDVSPAFDSHFYTCLDPEYFPNREEASTKYENNVFESQHSNTNSRISNLLSNKEDNDSVSSGTPPQYRKPMDILDFTKFKSSHTELLKSPFEEEPMYQFYQRDVQQRATLGYSADVSESEFEDDASSKFSDSDCLPPSRPPVLQSQLSAMDLVHGEGGQRTLWCEVPEVVESGILKQISSSDRKIQEAMFEVITSEASYLKSLNFLMEHFVQCQEFDGTHTNVLDKRERHVLFSDIQPVRDVSARLLADLEKRWLENIVLSNICDIIYQHANSYFSVYVKYCSNQLYQERTLKELKEKKTDFVTKLKQLESSSACQGLDMHSFLMLPMQRITRLPLLIDAIFHRLSLESPIYDSCKMALATVNKLVAECNEGARKMERMEEMLVISQQLDFRDCKGLGLLSASRWLVKKGELVQLMLDSSSRRTFGRSTRWCKIQLYLFLFTDLLVVTRKKSDENYSVVDFCPRNMLEVLNMDENMPPLPMRLPSSYRNIFRLTLLQNKEGKEAEMFLSCLLESDRTRWMDALMPPKSENPDEKIYEKWECKQVQCIHVYNAQQPDELSLEEADVVNVFRKITGWFEGERIRDGVQGWFPCSHVREIVNSHVIARNLRQRYRLLMLSRQYLEEQYKAQVAQSKK